MKKILIISVSVFSLCQSCEKQSHLEPLETIIPYPEQPKMGVSFEGYPVSAPADSLNELIGIPGIKLYAPVLGMDLNQKLRDTIRVDRAYLVSLPLRYGTRYEYSLAEICDSLSAIGMRNTGQPFVMASLRHMIPVLRTYGTTIRNQSRLIACLGDPAFGRGLGIFNFSIRSSLVSPYISVNAVDTTAGVTYGNQVLAILR